ncbi:hypothetical protein JCM3774_000634 [Rhodotorula dairenensis]
MLQRARGYARTALVGCSQCAYCTRATAATQDTVRPGKQARVRVGRPRPVPPRIDWSQPSTSKIPYSPPSSRPRSFASVPSRPAATTPAVDYAPANTGTAPVTLEETLERFLALETAPERLAARDSVCRFLSSAIHHSRAQPTPLSRPTFDSLWRRVAALEPAVSAAVLKRLRDLALALGSGQGWTALSHEQNRQVLAARTAQEKFEHRVRARTRPTVAVAPPAEGRSESQSSASSWSGAGAGSGSGGGKVMRARWACLDQCADDLLASVELRMTGRWNDSDLLEADATRQDAVALERYAHRLADRSSELSLETARRAAQFLHLALALSESLAEPVISRPHSAPLPALLAHDPPTGLRLLQTMLDKGRLPTPDSIRTVVRAHYRDPSFTDCRDAGARMAREADADDDVVDPREREEEAVYARARRVLEEACTAGGNSLSLPGLGVGIGSTSSSPPPSRWRDEVVDGRGMHDELESLLQERLERVERAEALLHEPTLYMIRWLGLLRRHRSRCGEDAHSMQLPPIEIPIPIPVEERQAALECALTLWDVSQVRGRDEFRVVALQTSKSTVAKLLESLVLEACELEREAAAAAVVRQDSPRATGAGRKREASAAVEKALELASKYLQHQVLVHHAPRLLRAVTVSANAPHLALALFDVLTDPRRINTRRRRRAYSPPFTWTLDLLPTFVTLFFSSATAKDDSLPVRLYLSWTASGLSFPDGLWNELWRALGRRGSVEELARVVADWEETGRGQVAGRISGMVLAAACEPLLDSGGRRRPGRAHAPLRMLAYFRSRYVRGDGDPAPTTAALLASSPYLAVPLSGYTAVLHALARSCVDQRSEQRVVWRYLLRDGHVPDLAAYNALLAAHVWRPDPHYSVKDLDDAGVVYNHLIEAGRHASRRFGGDDYDDANQQRALRPDRETFSLLVHGFLRIADSNRTGRQKRELTLEAAQRTFTAAADRGIGIRGHQAARLVRVLAHNGRFEDAKEVQEKWWRTLVALESGWDRWCKSYGRRGKRGESMWDDAEVKAEMREMRMAREDAERIETRGKASPVVVVESSSEAGETAIEEGAHENGAETSEAFATLSLGSTSPAS